MKSASPFQEAGRSLPFFLWVLVITGLLAAPSAFAAEFAAFGGTEIDEHGQGFTYAAFSVTQPVNKVFAVTGRVMPSYLTYKYYSGDRLIKAESPGVAVLGGVRTLLNKGSRCRGSGAAKCAIQTSSRGPECDVRGSTDADVIPGELERAHKYLNFFVW